MTLPQITKLLDNPTVRAGFAEALAESDIRLPLAPDPLDGHMVRDANSELVFTLDEAFAPETAKRIANLLCMATNAVASVSAEPVP